MGRSHRRLLEKRHPVLSVGSLGRRLGVCSMGENSEGVMVRYATLELDCECGQHTPPVREPLSDWRDRLDWAEPWIPRQV